LGLRDKTFSFMFKILIFLIISFERKSNEPYVSKQSENHLSSKFHYTRKYIFFIESKLHNNNNMKKENQILNGPGHESEKSVSS
jgi:hypothetical protein